MERARPAFVHYPGFGWQALPLAGGRSGIGQIGERCVPAGYFKRAESPSRPTLLIGCNPLSLLPIAASLAASVAADNELAT